MDRATLVNHLQLAERHVAEGQEQASRRQGMISRLEATGLGSSQTADLARQLLHSMLKDLALHIDDRNRLRDLFTE